MKIKEFGNFKIFFPGIPEFQGGTLMPVSNMFSLFWSSYSCELVFAGFIFANCKKNRLYAGCLRDGAFTQFELEPQTKNKNDNEIMYKTVTDMYTVQTVLYMRQCFL